MTVVDRLDAEDYLRGVVPLELQLESPNDGAALQAQAVAARSYTYSRLAEFLPRADAVARANAPYDLRATIEDQLYGGADVERASADRAVASTAGLVLPLAVAMFRATQPAMNVAVSVYIARWFGVPIEPGLRSRPGWLNDATGEVSDRP